MVTIPDKVKNLLKQDGTRKNFRVHFPNGERADITNDNIIEESVTLTESICSESKLRFGQCETPVLEFETTGVGKIKGCTIEASMEIDVTDAVKYKKVFLPGTSTFSMADAKTGGTIKVSGAPGFSVTVENTHPGEMQVGFSCDITDYLDEGEITYEITDDFLTVDSITVRNSAVTFEYEKSVSFTYQEPEDLDYPVYAIPYGVFVVDSCKKQADMSQRKIIAYSQVNYQMPDSFVTSMQTAFGTSKSTVWAFYAEYIKPLISPESYPMETVVVDDGYSAGAVTSRLSQGGHEYVLRVLFTTITQFGRRLGGLSIINEKHSTEYVSEVNELYEYLVSNGLNALINDLATKEYCTDFFNYHYVNGSNQYDVKSGNANTFRDFLRVKENNYYPVRIHRGAGDDWSYYQIDEDFYVPYGITLYADSELVYSIREEFPNKMEVDYASGVIHSVSGLYGAEYGCLQKTLDPTTGTKKLKVYLPNTEALKSLDLQLMSSAYCELQGKFGYASRDGEYTEISAKDNFDSPVCTITKNDYISLWYDDDYSMPIGRLICTFKKSNGSSDFLERKIVDDYDSKIYRTYSITFNAFIQNNAYTETQINKIFDNMAANISKNISFMPMELSMIGRPDLEAGDVVTIVTDEGNIRGFVEKRELSGISILKDAITSEDDTAENSNSGIKSDYDEDTGILTIYS